MVNIGDNLMALVECSSCNHQISNKAKACPNCGEPVEVKTRPAFKLIGIALIALFIVAILSDVDESEDKPQTKAMLDTSEVQEVQEELKPELDYSKPIYTADYALVCPIGIIFDKRAGYGLDGANEAALTVFGRAEKIKEIGCQEWKAGIRVYINDSQKGHSWQEASLHKDQIADIFILKHTLTNDPAGIENY